MSTSSASTRPTLRFHHSHSSQTHLASIGLGGEKEPQDSTALRGNLYADYVVLFRLPKPSSAQAPGSISPSGRPSVYEETLGTFHQIITQIRDAGLCVEVRQGEESPRHLLLFIQCSEARLDREVALSRVNDWLMGVRVADPTEKPPTPPSSGPGAQSVQRGSEYFMKDRLTDAERLRLVYRILTAPVRDGGAGITEGDEEGITEIFPLHDPEYNARWIKAWSKKTMLDQNDLDQLRDHAGETIAYYFDFLQTYSWWLIFPSVLGTFYWILDWPYSPIHAFLTVAWSVVFVEAWKRREGILAVRWGVRNCSRLESVRPEFRGDRMVNDPASGKQRPFYPMWKRLGRYCVSVPVIGVMTLVLSVFITFIFAFEVFILEYYKGPFLDYLHYTPLILYCASVPFLNAIYLRISRKLNDFENHETDTQYSAHLTYKIFVVNFLLGYLSIFLTSWVYLPYGQDIERLLKSTLGSSDVSHKAVGVDRLREQVIYYVLTAQVINFATETIVPWMSRKALRKTKRMAAAEDPFSSSSEGHGIQHGEGEDRFLRRVIRESERPVYDIYEDYSEMILQFGYVSLFSIVWPITPLLCLANNWVELRSDAVKINLNCRRPIPSRADSIGPWKDNLAMICWLSAVTNVLFLYQFSQLDKYPAGRIKSMQDAVILAVIAERSYFLLRWICRLLVQSLPSWADARVAHEEYALKQRWLHRIGIQEDSGLMDKGTEGAGFHEEVDTGRAIIVSPEESAREALAMGKTLISQSLKVE
ncbi:MAG: calcium-activated chloride channel-domain-containing protein [Piptocephalis tieghemiana]|nr:MAG: calcium-activated chloride channel-domain-containing protein [Piptocephalis tieghemiana]